LVEVGQCLPSSLSIGSRLQWSAWLKPGANLGGVVDRKRLIRPVVVVDGQLGARRVVDVEPVVGHLRGLHLGKSVESHTL
jgi:hypothetical protein